MSLERDLANIDNLVFGHPAAVLSRGVELDQQSLLDKVKKTRAFDPQIFEEENSAPFFWPAECSSNRVDSYFTRMAKSSLKNYANNLEDGIAFQPNHNHRVLPLGGSLSGKYVGAQGNGVSVVRGEFYTIPGLNISGVDSDGFIRGVRTGLVRDVSIGFYGGRFVCNICGEDMLRSWDCWHFPGFKYDVKNKKGEVIEKDKLCIADVEDANLAEVSGVYDGATPGAVILKAQQYYEAGKLKPEMARYLECQYNVRFRNQSDAFYFSFSDRENRRLYESTKEEGSTMKKFERVGEETDEQFAQRVIDEALKEPQTKFDAQQRQFDELSTLLKDVGVTEGGTLTDRARKLVQEAKDGRTYRSDLIDETLKQGVRAHGDSFDKDAYRTMLNGSEISHIKRMRDDFKAIGDKNHPDGRETTDEVDPAPEKGKKSKVPDSAFKAGRR